MKILDTILSQSAYSAEIDVPFDTVDIEDWLFTLPEAEYLRCPPDHIAAGVTRADDGRRMSINVEMIGTGLVVQHYVCDEAGPAYVRMNSISDVFTANGRTQVNVVWELIAEPAGNGRTRYTNRAAAGCDRIGDYSSADGDVLIFRDSTASVDDFELRLATVPGAGDAQIREVLVIHEPTGAQVWTLVDGAAQDHIWLQIGGHSYDLLA